MVQQGARAPPKKKIIIIIITIGRGAARSPISGCALGANTSSEVWQTWPTLNTQGFLPGEGPHLFDLSPLGHHFKLGYSSPKQTGRERKIQ